MGIAYDYLTRRHSAAYADAIELDRVRTDIKRMEDQLEKVTNELEGARVYAGVLTSSIATAQQLVEDECKRNDWPLPEAPAEPPAPAPIADRITRETTGTLAFEAIKVASPTSGEGGGIVCGNPGCGLELIHENGVFIHTATGMNSCTVETADETRPDDDPLRLQVLDQHAVREAVADHG